MEDSAPKPMSTSIDVFLNHRPNFQDSLGNWHILYPSVATEREGKAGRPSGDGVVLSAGRNVVKEEMERTQELVNLPGCKACLHGIVESVKSTAPNYQDLSTSIQLGMLLLKEIEELEVYVGAIHSHREEPPHVELSNTFL